MNHTPEFADPQLVSLDQAIARLKDGKLVAIPTETVYGLGANAADLQAVAKVFAAKGRPSNHPLIVHCASLAHAERFMQPPSAAMQTLLKAVWPGPLTLVTAKTDAVSPVITGGRDTVALRCPAHPLTRELLQRSGLALVAPSANRFGRVSPTSAAHVLSEFPGKDIGVLDGGECALGIESTIVRENADTLEVLRVGALSIPELKTRWPGPVIYNASTKGGVPGALATHYAPERGVWIWHYPNSFVFNENDLVCGWHKPDAPCQFQLLPDDPVQCAAMLYPLLRSADLRAEGRLIIEMPPATEAWMAIVDRLTRAAHRD